jgi:thiamine pyrophosphate-dependent acetolactate synthase large subunit-like protein
MEHVRLFQPITKQSAKLERIEDLGSLLDSMFRQATRGTAGTGVSSRSRGFAARSFT